LRPALEKALMSHFGAARWFAAPTKAIKTATLQEAVAVPLGAERSFLTLWQVEYVGADAEWYLVPLAFAAGAKAERVLREEPHRVVAAVSSTRPRRRGVLYDALGLQEFDAALLELIARRRRLKGWGGNVVSWRGPLLRGLSQKAVAAMKSASVKGAQRHTSIQYGERFVLKLFRRVHWGVNPELELGRFLTERSFPYAAPLAGALEYHRADGERLGVAAVHGWLAKAETGWEYTLRALDRYYERVLSLAGERRKYSPTCRPLMQLVRREFPSEVPELVGTYLESARLLGVRTAELHVALAGETKDPEFAPEPFTPYYQRSLYQAMRNTARRSLQKLRDGLAGLPAPGRAAGARVLEREPEVLKRLHSVLGLRASALRIRCHGDYGLGQVLHTGKDFVIVDFEGDPGQAVSERRIKRLVLRDLAGMLCSFRYAADAALTRQGELGRVATEQQELLAPWAGCWRLWVSVAFLKGYLDALGRSVLLSAADEALQPLLEVFLLHRLLDGLGDHLGTQPALVKPGCEGILELLQPHRKR
jgi:maltose alpha-D-glucosyltransferase/alpha-amylase